MKSISVYVVPDNIIIILLTIVSLFTGRYPELFIMAAGFLMILMTYASFCEDRSGVLSVLEFVLTVFFAVLSGGFTGFIAFFLLGTVRKYIRILLGVCAYVVTAMIIYGDMSLAMCIVRAVLLAAAFLIVMMAYDLVERMEEKKTREEQRLTASNVSEMHERRLNEQLVVQNFLAEKNARLVERENISRNIHNSVGHSITAAIMTLEAADALYDVRPEEARKKMNTANTRIRSSLEAIRRAVRVLDEDSAEISGEDLKYEMENIINEFVMDTDIRVDQSFCQLADEIRIPHDHAIFLTGALQEMLTNGLKHGNAGEFVVILTGDTAHIRLEVSDNGNSDFDTANGKSRIENGFGVRKIISYAGKCGGKTAFVNENGFKGMVELPIVFN